MFLFLFQAGYQREKNSADLEIGKIFFKKIYLQKNRIIAVVFISNFVHVILQLLKRCVMGFPSTFFRLGRNTRQSNLFIETFNYTRKRSRSFRTGLDFSQKSCDFLLFFIYKILFDQWPWKYKLFAFSFISWLTYNRTIQRN